MSEQRFYVSTPIYYVNDKPHIGHAYTTILADVLARYHKLIDGEQGVFFLTGVDEHGQKVQQAAEKRGVSPQAHCDEYHERFKELWEKLEIRYDDFIRTTEARHVRVVQEALKTVHANGDIYMAEYEGWYSVSEERFISTAEKDSGAFRDIKSLKERNWFFRMSRYQDQLVKYIHDHPQFIRPEHRKNEVLGFLRQPLGDLCISRPKSRMSWGIEIPFDPDYVTYVWFDALLNYVTGPGYLADEASFGKWWPADVHLIGKDILTTHSVYWPTMLMSLGLPLPKTIFAHGWWMMGDSKMSKSLGNVVSPLDLVDEYGVDAVRYYLMSEMVPGMDSNFTMESFVKRFNSDLANDFGNLLNRVSGLIGKYFDGKVPEAVDPDGAACEVMELAERVKGQVQTAVQSFEIQAAAGAVMSLVRLANLYMERQAPWKQVKENARAAGGTLYTATEALRIAAVLLAPIMPTKCEKVLDVLGATGSAPLWGGLVGGVTLQSHEALFPRLELKSS